jgi:hypothetical protein
MKKEHLIEQLETAKVLSSTVDIDKVIELIKQIETGGLTPILVDKISEKIERVMDYNSRSLVDLDSAEFELDYNNTIRLTDIDVNVYEIMDHVNAVLDEFMVEEDDVEEEDSTERTQFTISSEE